MSAHKPLANVRVIDLCSMISGPFATSILADQGADVIKVEQVGTGDLLRHIGFSRGGISAVFNTVNRNKRSLAIDLRTSQGKALLKKLVCSADIFVQNFRPGVVEEMGVDYASLKQEKPDLIYLSISGFGPTGPYSTYPAYDIVIQAMSGMASLQSHPETSKPDLIQNSVCDKVTAIYAAQAITAALFARERGVVGQHLQLSLLDATMAFLWPDGMEAQTLSGEDVHVPAAGMRELAHVFETRDGFMTLLAVTDKHFESLCDVLRAPELSDDDRFRTLQGRFTHAAAMNQIVKVIIANHETQSLCEALRARGVPVGPVLSPEELVDDPHIKATDVIIEYDHPVAGKIRNVGSACRFGAKDAGSPHPAPTLGQHSEEILTELGLKKNEIARLVNSGVIQ